MRSSKISAQSSLASLQLLALLALAAAQSPAGQLAPAGRALQRAPDWPAELRVRREAPASERLRKKSKPSKKRTFELDCLAAHNRWRRLHAAPELKLDAKIAKFAQKRADFIAQSDGVEFRHPPDLSYGENLAWHSNAAKSCAELVRMWYDEIELYDFKRPQFDHQTGHFTQLVWRDTKRLGCARATSSGPRGGVYLVCNYDPPGNFLGEEATNVAPKLAAGARDLAPTSTTPAPTTTTSTSTTQAATSTTQAAYGPTGGPSRGGKKRRKKGGGKKKSAGKRRKSSKKKSANKKATTSAGVDPVA